MRKILLIFLVLFAMVYSKTDMLNEFPLWGSSWIVASGRNPRVYPSIAPDLVPKKLIFIKFRDDSIEIKWANLVTHDYASTKELLDDVLYQFERNRRLVSVGKNINNIFAENNFIIMSKVDVSDTVWSCKDAFLSELNNYEYFVRFIDGKEQRYSYSDISNMKRVYRREIPRAYGVISMSRRRVGDVPNSQYPIYDKIRDAYYKRQGITDDELYDYCYRNKCYEVICCDCFANANNPKVESRSYWQLHLYPKTLYNPRSSLTGKIIPNIKMSISEAMSKRRHIIKDNIKDVDSLIYRNPVLNKDSSVIISFAFLDRLKGESKLTKRKYITLSSTSNIKEKANEPRTPIDFTHTPDKMYRVITDNGELEEDAIKTAILKLYTESEESRKLMATINFRCPNWETIDEINGKLMYPEKDRSNGNYKPDPKYEDISIFEYNKCPCSPIPELNNYTASQLKSLLVYNPPPFCSKSAMLRALDVYTRALNYLTAPKDIEMLLKKISLTEGLIKKKELFYKYSFGNDAEKIAKYEENCDKTWVVNFERN